MNNNYIIASTILSVQYCCVIIECQTLISCYHRNINFLYTNCDTKRDIDLLILYIYSFIIAILIGVAYKCYFYEFSALCNANQEPINNDIIKPMHDTFKFVELNELLQECNISNALNKKNVVMPMDITNHTQQ